MSYLAAALVLLAPSHAYGASVRTEVNFNYGWRFFYTEKNESAGPGTCAFPKSLDGLDCSGLERNPNRFVAGDCARACCYLEDRLFWQHSGRECLHGYAGNLANITCTEPKTPSKYTGGQRDAKPNPPFLTNRTRGNADFDDSDWERVTLPHDFVARNGTITETASDRHGYFTRGVGWYRKRFSIPDEFKGDGIFLRFEGAFHVADIYVNGRFIQTHSTGYLGFTVRLDNLTTVDGSTAALHFGGKGDNVVAIRCDASFGSGHWFEGGGSGAGLSSSASAAVRTLQKVVFLSILRSTLQNPRRRSPCRSRSRRSARRRWARASGRVLLCTKSPRGLRLASARTKRNSTRPS